jgi:Na+/H+-dicarboxylate symporter
MDCVHEELKVPRKVSDFVLPIGATVNMDGTALYEGVAVIFLIQLFGGLEGAAIELGAVTTVVIFLTAVLASIGAAAVPDAGLVTLVLVANAVGLDPQYIVLIFPVDALVDMFRTSTNVMGDSVGAVVVNRYTSQ